MDRVEFFFDLSSPWTYLAFHNVQPILKETGATARWRSVLVGGIFNAVNQSIYQIRDMADSPKVKHLGKSLQDWARLSGLPMNFPSVHHPIKSVAVMRCCCVMEGTQNQLQSFSKRAFDAYFREQLNLDDEAVLIAVAKDVGLDGEDLITQSRTQSIKDQLRANTEEAIQRGAFGSPTIFVDGTDQYFGNDQLPLVRAALLKAA
ncbi:MAG: 2-hydroxychromene-2-carboxylate isomerase [Pseudomonadota bacterium]